MTKFVDRMVGRTPPEGESGGDDELMRNPPAPSPTVSRLAGYTAQEDQPQDDWLQVAPPLAADEDAVELVTDYGKLGEHVTSVLEAAKTAAAKIKQEAGADAQRVADRTRQEAKARLEEARREADKISVEAERVRTDAEKESRETTERANAYSTEKRQEAEAEASAIVARAKREASEHTRAAQERGSTLARNVALSEERLGQLVSGLRDLAGRLEELVHGERATPTGDQPEGPPVEASLEESLHPSAKAQAPESWT